MAKASERRQSDKLEDLEKLLVAGPGGATHQTAKRLEDSGAHGYFEVAKANPHLTRASFLAERGKKTEGFARFSTVVGGAGDAFGHLKVIGHTSAAQPLFAKANLADNLDEGVINLDTSPGVGNYIEAAKQQRVRAREARLAGVDA